MGIITDEKEKAASRRSILASILLHRIMAASGVLCGALEGSKTLKGKAQKIYGLAQELESDLRREPSALQASKLTLPNRRKS